MLTQDAAIDTVYNYACDVQKHSDIDVALGTNLSDFLLKTKNSFHT